MVKILIIGCGDVGYGTGLALQQRGHKVMGLKRHAPPANRRFEIFSADIANPASLSAIPAELDAVLFIVSADSRQPGAYQTLYDTGLGHLLTHFSRSARPVKWLMVSSSSVYGQNQGEWVDENSETKPGNSSSPWLLAAENRVLAAGPNNCIVRFSGIYGPGRDWLLRRAAAGEAIQRDPPLFTNRIHRDDCVAVLVNLLEKQLAGELPHNRYLASDDDPAPLWEVMAWLAERHGYPPPTQRIAPAGAPQNKRCDNARLKQLGYRFIYPGYREGYAAYEIKAAGFDPP